MGCRRRGAPAQLGAEVIRALVFSLLLLAGCASKEQAVQNALNGAMLACDVLIEDKTIPRTPEAQAFCERLRRGCVEAAP